MPSHFQTMFDAATEGQFDHSFGIDVTYSRGDLQVEFVALVSMGTAVSQSSADGYITERRVAMVRIRRERLVLGGSVVLPQRGDKILFTADGETQEYEVGTVAGAAIYELDQPHTTLIVTGVRVQS